MQIHARLCTQTCTVTFFSLKVRMCFGVNTAKPCARTCTAAHTKPDMAGVASLLSWCFSLLRVVVAQCTQVCWTVKDSASTWTCVNICFSLSCSLQHCHSGVFVCREVLGRGRGSAPFDVASCAQPSSHMSAWILCPCVWDNAAHVCKRLKKKFCLCSIQNRGQTHSQHLCTYLSVRTFSRFVSWSCRLLQISALFWKETLFQLTFRRAYFPLFFVYPILRMDREIFFSPSGYLKTGLALYIKLCN